MSLISKRQKDILLLLAKSPEAASAQWIAKQLNLSDRTVRNEIKQLQEKSDLIGIKIEMVRGMGYRLMIIDSEKLLKAKEISQLSKYFAEQEDRVAYILKRLLLSKDFLKMAEFENEMFVSKSTLQTDLKKVRKRLGKYQLELITRPHYGSKVKGDEYMKRLCLSHSIFNRYGGDKPETSNISLLFEQIRGILIKKINEYQLIISDIELENLTTHIAIACKRIEEGFIIETIHHQFNKQDYAFEWLVAAEIIREVEVITGLKFPTSEIDYIMLHLLGTKMLPKENVAALTGFEEVNPIVESILDQLQTGFGWNFHKDQEFVQGITLHLRPAINRLRFHMGTRNPLLEDIKERYPDAFEGAVMVSKCIEDSLQLKASEHEIAYLAVHIGAALERMKTKKKRTKKVLIVCATGVGSAKLLYYRLKNVFEKEIEIVGTISYYHLSSYDLSNVDIIISTLPVSSNLKVPVVVVNNFLEEKDVRNIENHLAANPDPAERYLAPSRIFIHRELSSKESIIRYLCGELYKQDLVPKNYLEMVLKRESLAATCYGNLVAVPHPIEPVTDQTFWTICTLKHPIQWSEERMVQFVCLLNIKKELMGTLNSMYQQLVKVIESKSTVQKLISSTSAEKIIRIMSRQIS
ncbi:BglG family transcription antiterminator [Heyndrickxia acidiproducens]|uniref:BglG family transcription antiterminator n=1 Tax=Heyndrickxia acidiproducens TaxID=1121084 RepID=UPI0003625F65|nr:BglG family transcription antiterminator [Heyndrickxia acidiproducens]